MLELPLDQRIVHLRARIEAAAKRVGRDPTEVALVAVSKGVPALLIRRAQELGVRCMGESRTQEALVKQATLQDLHLEWHFIGHLQTNKVHDAVGRFALVHSVDSLRLLEAVGRQATQVAVRQRVLLQVNVAADPAKHGFAPEQVEEAVTQAQRTEGVALEGFMTVGPKVATAEEARPTFARLKDLRDQVAPGLKVLSMGMSHDFEVAVEEGATLVRVGTGLFGSRDQGEDG